LCAFSLPASRGAGGLDLQANYKCVVMIAKEAYEGGGSLDLEEVTTVMMSCLRIRIVLASIIYEWNPPDIIRATSTHQLFHVYEHLKSRTPEISRWTRDVIRYQAREMPARRSGVRRTVSSAYVASASRSHQIYQCSCLKRALVHPVHSDWRAYNQKRLGCSQHSLLVWAQRRKHVSGLM